MRAAYVLNRPQKVFVVCAAIFLTALVIAEATAGKFFTLLGVEFNSVIMTAGVIAFPVTFIVTDVMNEYFGKRGIRFVTFLGMAMVVFEFLILQAALAVPTAEISPVPDEAFATVFGTTSRVIFGSLTAYVIGQLADITLFHWLRRLTDGRHLWLRATGSTFGSQFLDTFIVLIVAFAGQLAFAEIVAITLFNYGYKLVIAIVITPLIYAAHAAIDRYLGHDLASSLIEQAASGDEAAPPPHKQRTNGGGQ